MTPVMPFKVAPPDQDGAFGRTALVVRPRAATAPVAFSAELRGRLSRAAFRTSPPVALASESFLRAFAPFWNLLIPKHAVGRSVGPDPARKGAIRYLHATKGWQSISPQRLAALGFSA